MTPHDIALIRRSFEAVKPIAPLAAALFYGRLFEIAPEVKPLFKGDMEEQGRKLMTTLAVVVNGLSDLPALLPTAEVLAKRHVAYGVTPAHYQPVGEALIWTLQRGLDGGWTPELESAWTRAYGLLAGAMIAAAYPRHMAA